jgi:hypothetical protein
VPLIQLIVVLVVVGVALYLLDLVPIDATVRTIIKVLVILFLVLWIIQALGLMEVGPVLRLK